MNQYSTDQSHKAEWDLSPLFPNDSDQSINNSQKQATEAVGKFVTKWAHKDDYLENSDVLFEALKEYELLMTEHGLMSRANYYFSLRTAQDQLDPALKGRSQQIEEATTHLVNELQFFTIRLAKVSAEAQQRHLEHAALTNYRHWLKKLFEEGRYILSEEQEMVLNLTSSTSYDAWVRMTSTFLSQDQVETLLEDGSNAPQTLSELLSLTNSTQKEVRDQAAHHVHSITAKYAPVATEELNALCTYKKITDQLRGLSRPDQARHLSDDLPSSVVDAMLEAVEQQYGLAHRFYALKAKLMGVDKLQYHERNVPHGSIMQSYSFDQSLTLVTDVFQHLDGQFANILIDFSNNGQFDIYPRQGKVGGAFCAHNLISLPTYVLLNHTNQLQDVLTLAHEMGHAINNELMRAKQTALNFDTPLSTAEVASTFMEDFVLDRLSQEADKETQLALIMMKLGDDISSIFRQVAGYRFEQELHNQHRQVGYLSTEAIGQIFTKHMSNYMGSQVDQSSGSQNWWVYWSHFRHHFYVYSYASGLLISKSLQNMVRQNPKDIELVKTFLTAGSSDAPQDIFLAMGIDINQADFWLTGLKEIDQLIEKAEIIANDI